MSPPFTSPLIIWIFLIASTGLTYAIGEFTPLTPLTPRGQPSQLLIVGVIAIALFKGSLVILDYMELRHAPALWRRIVLGWLLLVAAGIVFAYLK